MSKIRLGIDIGNVNTYMCSSDTTDSYRFVFNYASELNTPSTIYFCKDMKDVYVGQMALDAGILEPNRVVSNIKNYLSIEDYEFEMGYIVDEDALRQLVIDRFYVKVDE